MKNERGRVPKNTEQLSHGVDGARRFFLVDEHSGAHRRLLRSGDCGLLGAVVSGKVSKFQFPGHSSSVDYNDRWKLFRATDKYFSFYLMFAVVKGPKIDYAHQQRQILTALGTRKGKSSTADRLFVPVVPGSFSTLLGILMLGFSEFEFVVKYFLILMTALIGTGENNGLILLPILLSWFGPRREISPTDGKSTLALRPPLQENLNSSSSGGSDSDVGDEPSSLVMYSCQVTLSKTSGETRGTPSGGNNPSHRFFAV